MKTIVAVISFTALLTLWIFIKNPILIKWVTGTARFIGRPEHARIYTDGKENDKVKLFKTKTRDETETEYWVLYFQSETGKQFKPVLCFELLNKILWRPNSSVKDYNYVFGFLFQSESGDGFKTEEDTIPIMYNNNQVSFKVPFYRHNYYNCDSIRIKL